MCPFLGSVGFGLAEEMAARQQQDAVDMAQPFSAAARTGELDPFALADEQLKVPRELLEPYEASQQVLDCRAALRLRRFPSSSRRIRLPDRDF